MAAQTTRKEGYSGLAFSFADMQKEILNIADVASDFITDISKVSVLPGWLQRLKNIQSGSFTNIQPWEIPEDEPLRTIETKGTYETKGGKGFTVYGTLSTIWDIQVSKRNDPKFILMGRASTIIRIYKSGDNSKEIELASWHFDTGDAQSPGCHFHVQMLRDKGDNVLEEIFPVPRFPSLLITPMDGLEFLLGELFQADWVKRVSEEDSQKQIWAACQRQRIVNLLDWKRQAILGTGTPWIAYKLKKPHQNIFVEKPNH